MATGPTGPAGLKAFAQISSENAAVMINAGVPEQVPLTDVGASLNMTAAPSSITTAEEGYYLLSYNLYATFEPTAAGYLSFAVRANGKNIEQTVSNDATPGRVYSAGYTGDVIVHLPAGAVIDVAVECTADTTMYFDTSSISSFTMYKID